MKNLGVVVVRLIGISSPAFMVLSFVVSNHCLPARRGEPIN
ncbi:MAG: hypothetical protein WAN51_12270 [Alphaproteobacteria bacterium]